MNPLDVLTGRLLIRLLDDVHTIALAARELPAVERRLTERIDRLEDAATGILGAAERVDDGLREALLVARDLSARGGDIAERADRLDSRGRDVIAMADRLERTGIDAARAGDRLAESMPRLEAALGTALAIADVVEPLQGAAERLGRIVDRLPGAPRRTDGDPGLPLPDPAPRRDGE